MSNDVENAIREIVKTNRAIAAFWKDASGWAPDEATRLLSKSRLDLQIEMSESLRLWIHAPDSRCPNAHLILGWANLGALVEGTMKWFLSVFYEAYKTDVNAIVKKGNHVEPGIQSLEPLRQFFQKSIWSSSDDWNDWVLKIQKRRNAIHAFTTRDLGDHDDFKKEIVRYLEFLVDLQKRVPYPDEW